MKACKDCPFLKSTPLDGAPDWLTEVIKKHDQNPFFRHTCHKTDPEADGYVGGKKKSECVGHITIMMNEIDKTPGKDGVYDSIRHLGLTYVDHYQKLLAGRSPGSYTNQAKERV